MKKVKEKKRFSREMANLILNNLISMDMDELNEVILECKTLSETNCWWAEYHLKDIIIELASSELELKFSESR